MENSSSSSPPSTPVPSALPVVSGPEVPPVPSVPPVPLSGRRAQAAKNDKQILESAKAVFIADPSAPISDVAHHAGVGMSALYKRYGSKDELLRILCSEGLQQMVDVTEAALADNGDAWTVFTDYMSRLVETDTSSMTLALAGKFVPTSEMRELSQKANELANQAFERAKALLRDGVDSRDISLVLEMVAAVRVSDGERTKQLRQRYLTMILDGLRAGAHGRAPLPGPEPSWQEISERWAPHGSRLPKK